MAEVTNYNDWQLQQAGRDTRQLVKYPPFDETVAESILDAVRCGMSLRTVRSLAGVPRWGIVRTWMETNPQFKQAYEDALEDQAEFHIERGDKVAADTERDASCRKVELDWLRDRIKWASPSRYGKDPAGVTANVTVAVQNNVTVPPAEAYQRLIKGG